MDALSESANVFEDKDLLSVFLQVVLLDVVDCTRLLPKEMNVAELSIEMLSNLCLVKKSVRNLLVSREIINLCSNLLSFPSTPSTTPTRQPELTAVPRNFVAEYNHRFLRYRSLDMGQHHHLLWALKDRDIKTFRYILPTCIPDTEDTYHFQIEKWYKLFFEAGCRGYEEFLTALSTHLPKHESVSNLCMYLAGLAYSGGEITELDLCKMDHNELSLLLFEAIRGDNTKLIERIKSKQCKDDVTIPYSIIVAHVAADNLEELLPLLNLSESRLEEQLLVPIIGNLDQILYYFDPSHFVHQPYLHQLIVYALHYGSYKVLKHLESFWTQYYKLRVDISSGITPLTLESYNWLKDKIKISHSDKRFIIESASEQGKFDLADALVKGGCKAKSLSWEMIDNYIESNPYYAIEWHRLNKSDNVLKCDRLNNFDSVKASSELNTAIQCIWRNSGYAPVTLPRAF